LGGEEERRTVVLAEKSGFEIFLTLDQGMEYEQNLMGREIGVIIVSAKSNRLADLVPRIPAIPTALRSVRSGQLVRLPD
jgi:hypothetical protein